MSTAPLAEKGKWRVTPAPPPRTRPGSLSTADQPERFDGTVVVEWLNVTAGIDAPAAWLSAHIQMIRSGMAYVGVDAQAGGINGQVGIDRQPGLDRRRRVKRRTRHGTARSTTPATATPTASTSRPVGPIRSYGRKLLGGLRRSGSWSGESQSAFRLVTYIDARFNRCPPVSSTPTSSTAGAGTAPTFTVPAGHHHHPGPDVHPHGPPRARLPVDTEATCSAGLPAARDCPDPIIREWESPARPTTTPMDCSMRFGQREWRRRHGEPSSRCSTLGRPDPRHRRLSGARQRRIPHLRAPGGDVGCQPVDGHGTPSGTVAPPGGRQGGPTRVRHQRGGRGPRWRPHAPGERPDRQALRPRSAGILHATECSGRHGDRLGCRPVWDLRHHGAVARAATLARLYPTHAAFLQKWDAATAAEVKAGYLLPADARTLDKVAAQSTVGG